MRRPSRILPVPVVVALIGLAATAPACLPEYEGPGDDDAADDDGADDDAADDDGADDDAADDDATEAPPEDGDGDGVPASEGDCDDADPNVYPYAWEDLSDGVDNDCDGAVDYEDGDLVTQFTLYDDDYREIGIGGFVFPFCGEAWTSVWFIDNGRVTFGTHATSYSESASSFLSAASPPSIAPWWDDLLTEDGTLAYSESEGALALYWIGVSQNPLGGDDPDSNTLTVVLLADGRFRVHLGGMAAQDGLVGWSCATNATVAETDLTALVDAVPPGSRGIGRGTEDAVYEVFSGTAPDLGDLAGRGLTFCSRTGVDADHDSWTDNCGDCDDGDGSVHPGQGC